MKLRFAVVSILAFFLFAFPVLNNYHKFTTWVTNLFIHKGAYGSGERGIVDIPYFINNLRIIIISSRQLWIPVLLASILYMMYFRKNKDVFIRIGAGLSLSVIFHILITAKHYAFYYLVPSLLMTFFMMYIVYMMLTKKIPLLVKRKIPQTIFIITVLIVVMHTVLKMNRQLTALLDRKKMHLEAVEAFKPYLTSSQEKLIITTYYGCSAIEYSLLFGLLESGRYGKELTAEFKKHYPSTIFYLPWADAFYDGVYKIDPKEFLKPGLDYTLFVADHTQELVARITGMLGDTTGYVPELKLLKEYKPKSEAVYQLQLID